jgi:hypothetical protein
MIPTKALTIPRTMTGTGGDFLQFSGAMQAAGSVSSTDSNGEPTCITDWETTLQNVVTYSGRIRTADDQDVEATLLDLADYFPGEGAFEQCNTVWQGPPPIALRAADTIVEPILTTFRSSTTDTQASTSSSASARPASSGISATPSSTSGSRTTVADASTPAEEFGGPTTSSIPIIPASLPEDDDDATETTAESSTLDSTKSSQYTSADPLTLIETISSGDDTMSEIVTSGVTHQDDSRSLATPLRTSAVGANDNFVSRITSFAQAHTLAGPTISQGGGAVVVSGTSFSALPSNLGVVAIDNSGSTMTIRAPQLETYGIHIMSDSPGAYVLPEQTLVRDGPAIVISGATYSALPKGSGINIAVSGQTSSIAITDMTNVPGIGEVGVADSDKTIDGYVLDGSVTVTAGGAAATISNTVYTALPSGFGVLVAGGCGSDDVLASYIAQGVGGTRDGESGSGDQSCIIGASSLPVGEESEVTVAGVEYSALPSEAGVLVVANGESKTIGLASTVAGTHGGQDHPTATNGSIDTGTGPSVATYTGASSPSIGHPAGGWSLVGMVVVVSTVWCRASF